MEHVTFFLEEDQEQLAWILAWHARQKEKAARRKQLLSAKKYLALFLTYLPFCA